MIDQIVPLVVYLPCSGKSMCLVGRHKWLLIDIFSSTLVVVVLFRLSLKLANPPNTTRNTSL